MLLSEERRHLLRRPHSAGYALLCREYCARSSVGLLGLCCKHIPYAFLQVCSGGQGPVAAREGQRDGVRHAGQRAAQVG